MFEDWPISFHPPVWRRVDPPRQVVVDLAELIPPPPDDSFRLDHVKMSVKAEGLLLAGRADGLLYAWARTTRGGWLAYVEVTVATGNGRGRLVMRQWCTRRAIMPS